MWIVATCTYHADRETGRSCTRCGRPACSDCLRDAPVGSHCRDCIREGARSIRRPTFRRTLVRTPVTAALIAVNLAVFLAVEAQRAPTPGRLDLLGRLALFGPAVAEGEWYRLVTSGFLHFGLMHIGFNMLALYRLGGLFESTFGRLPYLGLFTASLLAGSFGAILLSPDAITGGASGAVFGIIGAVAVVQRRNGVAVLQSDVGGLLVINLLLTFLFPGISIGGHLGGLLGGAAVAAATPHPPLSSTGVMSSLGVASAISVAAVVGAVLRAGM